MLRVWRADRCVQDASAHNYIRWIKWFRFYIDCLGLEERAELTQEGACRFAKWYSQRRCIDYKQMPRAQTADLPDGNRGQGHLFLGHVISWRGANLID